MLHSLVQFVRHKLLDNPDRWDPMLAVYYLTYACDFRCPYCSDGAGTPYYRLSSPALDFDRIRQVLRTLRGCTENLVITGGEPLRHPQVSAILEWLPTLRYRHVILTTNGLELEPLLAPIAASVRELVVSIDTLDEKKADAWHGVGSGSLRRILANLELAARWPSRRYDIVISAVVTPDNLADLYDVQGFARDHGFRLAASPQLCGTKAHPRLFDNEAYRAFYDHLIAQKDAGCDIEGTVLYLEHMRDLAWFRCHPFTMVAVAPNGDVFYPCLELGTIGGNLLTQPDLSLIRRSARSVIGPQPDCDTRCHSPCALGFSLLLEHPTSFLPGLSAGRRLGAGRRRR